MRESDPIVDRDVKVGALIRHVRKEMSLTVREVATKLGVSRTFMEHIEKGNRHLPARIVRALCDLLDCYPDDIGVCASCYGSGYHTPCQTTDGSHGQK
jgi:transcriptional regulator with XRE-family HTH domain